MFESQLLIGEMTRLGVHYLIGDCHPGLLEPLSPPELLAGLAAHSDARLRLAIIAVLLQHPDYSSRVHAAMEMLNERQRLTFKLYYTAAHYLQLAYFGQLQSLLGPFQKLPDFFSEEMKIQKNGSTSDQLKQLANHHLEVSGLPINWYGTYRYAAQRVLKRLEKEREWSMV